MNKKILLSALCIALAVTVASCADTEKEIETTKATVYTEETAGFTTETAITEINEVTIAETEAITTATEVTTTVAETTKATTASAAKAPTPAEPKYITETVEFDGKAVLTYTYREDFKPGKVSLEYMNPGSDFPEEGYYEERQTHNGWKPSWATVTKRSLLRRENGDILIEYVDNGPVIAYIRVSDNYRVEVGFSEELSVDDAIVEELANTFVFEDYYEHLGEEWMFTYNTPNYDEWAEVDGDYVIWEFTKNAAGEFELTYSEGDVLCIPYVTFGADKIVYATQKTQIPPADEIGKPHTLKAHDKISSLYFLDTEGGTIGGTYADSFNAYGVYADEFLEYCMYSTTNAEILREHAAVLRNVLRVFYNGEEVDGIGVALPNYYFTKEHQYEWQFVFSKPYGKEDVNTVRIELQIPDYLKSIYPEGSMLCDLGAMSFDSIENCTFIHEYMSEVQEKVEEIDGEKRLPDYDFESSIAITDSEDLKLFEHYNYVGDYIDGNLKLYAWPAIKRITMTVLGREYKLYLMSDNSIVASVSGVGLRVYQAEEQYKITDEIFNGWILKYDETVSTLNSRGD